MDRTNLLALNSEEVLPAELRAALLSRAQTVRARQGQTVLMAGAMSAEVYFIVSGRVRVSVFSPLGRETILREMGNDRLFGELSAIDDQPRSATVVALEDSVLACMSGPQFRAFLSEVPAAGLWMAQQLAARVRNLTEKTFEMATLSVSSRLQNELLRLCLESSVDGDRCVLRSLPTHADLAARIGTHREAVTRELGLLAKEGILSQAGRSLAIHSICKLQSLLARTCR